MQNPQGNTGNHAAQLFNLGCMKQSPKNKSFLTHPNFIAHNYIS